MAKVWIDQYGFLNWHHDSQIEFQIKLMTVYGQVLLEMILHNSGRMEIENQLPNGIYFYQLNQGSN